MNRQLEVVDTLASKGHITFATRDVEELAGLSPQAASNLLTRMVQNGLVDRVARGRYALRPIGALGTHAATEDVALAVSAAFHGRPHRIAYRSALDHHGLLQHPTRRITVATDRNMSLDEISGRPLRVVIENSERLAVGAVAAEYGAQVSSVERALLESASRPQLVGGIEIVASALAVASIDSEQLQAIAEDLDLRAGLHRLGSIADALGLSFENAGIQRMSVAAQHVPLDPAASDVVWRDDRWGVSWPLTAAELDEVVHR